MLYQIYDDMKEGKKWERKERAADGLQHNL
jgi:hypothetical protein